MIINPTPAAIPTYQCLVRNSFTVFTNPPPSSKFFRSLNGPDGLTWNRSNIIVVMCVSYLCCTHLRLRVVVFNATFNNISVILWQSVLLLGETGVPGKKPPTSRKQLTNSTNKEYKIFTICICSLCCHHSPVLSTFITYHQMFGKSNRMGSTRGTGIVYLSGLHIRLFVEFLLINL